MQHVTVITTNVVIWLFNEYVMFFANSLTHVKQASMSIYVNNCIYIYTYIHIYIYTPDLTMTI
jgi:hypothetical protein